MRFIVCGDALFSSRNLENRLDKKMLKSLNQPTAALLMPNFVHLIPKHRLPAEEDT